MKMKSVVVDKLKSFKNIESEIPPLEEGKALIKVSYAGICGSDVLMYAVDSTVGTVIGHEFSGVVVDPGTSGLKPGDKVIAPETNPCGKCEYCLSGRDYLCPSLLSDSPGISRPGAYGEYIQVRADLLIKVPDDYDMKLGALVEPIAISLHAVNQMGLPKNKKVLIWGNGPVGAYAAFVAKRKLDCEVYMVGRNQPRVDFCNKLPYVDKCFSMKDPDFDAKLEAVAPGGFEYALDCVLAPGGMDQVLTKLKGGAHLSLVGAHSSKLDYNTGFLLSKGTIMYAANFFTLAEFKEAYQFTLDYPEELGMTITSTVALDADAITAAYDKLFYQKGGSIEYKVLIDHSKKV
jgi:threonine dehydrogenase-like Zn-dependent dehydrogenase